MTSEDIINDWVSVIESIEVNGLKRKINRKKSYSVARNISFSAQLEDLSNGIEEDLNYKSKNYSLWCYNLINIFIEKIQSENGNAINNSNWTKVKFQDENQQDYGFIEYRTFDLSISVKLDYYITITREKKIRNLGL